MQLTWFIIVTCATFSFGHELQSNFEYEETCTNGPRGYCVLESECHHPVDSNYKDFCPRQKHLGAVCCKDFSIEKVNCFQSHNICRPISECKKVLDLGRKGCPSKQTCCALV